MATPSGAIVARTPLLASPTPPAAAFLSHFQATGGDQCLLLREALAARGARAWLDVDAEALTTAAMAEGAAGVPLFVLLLSRGVLTRWAVVEKEVRVALARWRGAGGGPARGVERRIWTCV